MDLMCHEEDAPLSIQLDHSLLQDDTVLQNLLAFEDTYRPDPAYFRHVQKDITSIMRRQLAEWMLEVCEDEMTEPEVFPLSINYLDRFLSISNTPKSRLQLLGSACVFIASKLKEVTPISAENLVKYTDYSINTSLLKDMQLLVLSKLNWRLLAVIPNDFIEQILYRLSLDRENSEHIRKRANTLIIHCATDCRYMSYPQSIIAASSVSEAVHESQSLKSNDNVELLKKLQDITGTTVEQLMACQEDIKHMSHAHVSNKTSQKT